MLINPLWVAPQTLKPIFLASWDSNASFLKNHKNVIFYKICQKKIECRISCFPSGALLEGCFSGPGKRKMQFQYYSSWFHPDPLKLLKKSWRNTDFFLKIFRLPISSFLLAQHGSVYTLFLKFGETVTKIVSGDRCSNRILEQLFLITSWGGPF